MGDGDTRALAPMVRRLMHTAPGEVLYDTLLSALEEFGPAVAPVALDALASVRNADERFGLLSVLSHCGVSDERIYATLLEQLQEEPIPAAMNLALYGDARAIEPLTRALEAHEMDEDGEDLFVNQAIIELRFAIERLGGTLDAAQLEKAARARRSRHLLSSLFQRVLDTPPPSPREAGPASRAQ
jgi:DNA polymerase III epsilon subunit-like protein